MSTLDQDHEARRLAALQTKCRCGDCLRNGWDFCPLSNAQEEESAQRKRADALYEKRLPFREAEIAQKRYEDAEATIERLKCCGNCGQPHSFGLAACYTLPAVIHAYGPPDADGWTYIEPDWSCPFAPSRWTERTDI